MKKLLLGICFVVLSAVPALFANEPWVVWIGDVRYKAVQELFLTAGIIPPLEELPLTADQLRLELSRLAEKTEDLAILEGINTVYDSLTITIRPLSPILAFSLCAYYYGDDQLNHVIPTFDYDVGSSATFTESGKDFLDYRSMYFINSIPPLLSAGFTGIVGPVALVFNPYLMASLSTYTKYYNGLNIPQDLAYWDVNVPYRGMLSFWNDGIELRVARSKLQIGPGLNSSLFISKTMPYFDYAMIRFNSSWFYLSWYLIQLNPIISQEESEYMDYLYDNPEKNPYDNTQHEKLRSERAKHVAVARLFIRPLSWFSFAVMQINMISGRYPEISDVFPFNLYHNTFVDGMYSTPIDVTVSFLPYKGIYLYFDYFLFDAVVGDESASSDNPGGSAFQVGMTVLSSPFFQLGPGRFRLDVEFTLVEPWVYGAYFNYKKFTSRIVTVEPFEGRHWVDYPLGFYQGPDCIELVTNLSYGSAGSWEININYTLQGKGEVDLYGYGDSTDFSHRDDFTYNWTLSNVIQWTNSITLSGYIQLRDFLEISAWLGIYLVTNKFHQQGDNQVFVSAGVNCTWTLF